jgi:mannose/fructose/N-acetylgalactosamine-specific phosphotransferase system component IIC
VITVLALISLGGLIALDATSFGQLMLSRPMVAGSLSGAICGVPFEGALLGALLEALSLGILPVGASRYPETGTAAVAATGAFGLAHAPVTPAVLLLALIFGLTWQRLAGLTVILGRYANERMVRAGRPGPAHMDRLIEHRHLETMALDIMRGMLLTILALLAGVPLLRFAIPYWTLPHTAAAFAVAIATAAVLGSTAPLFAESPRGRLMLLAGVVCASLILSIR